MADVEFYLKKLNKLERVFRSNGYRNEDNTKTTLDTITKYKNVLENISSYSTSERDRIVRDLTMYIGAVEAGLSIRESVPRDFS